MKTAIISATQAFQRSLKAEVYVEAKARGYVLHDKQDVEAFHQLLIVEKQLERAVRAWDEAQKRATRLKERKDALVWHFERK